MLHELSGQVTVGAVTCDQPLVADLNAFTFSSLQAGPSPDENECVPFCRSCCGTIRTLTGCHLQYRQSIVPICLVFNSCPALITQRLCLVLWTTLCNYMSWTAAPPTRTAATYAGAGEPMSRGVLALHNTKPNLCSHVLQYIIATKVVSR